MDDRQKRRLYKDVITYFGVKNQESKSMEECGELVESEKDRKLKRLKRRMKNNLKTDKVL